MMSSFGHYLELVHVKKGELGKLLLVSIASSIVTLKIIKKKNLSLFIKKKKKK